MRTKNKKMKGKAVWVLPIITIIIAISLLSLPKIMVISPTGHISDNNPLFRWNTIHGYSYFEILIDDNQEFTSPLIIITTEKQHKTSNLSAGDYYWKVVGYNRGIDESRIEYFTIESIVAVSREKEGIRNAGNVAILLDFFRRGVIIGHAVLDIDKISDVNKSVTEIEARQK